MELNNYLPFEDRKNRILTFVLILSIIAGFLIRIKGLGKWPLTVDEYYIVKSIQSILENGLPRFEYGGYYERGLLYQYLTAGLLLLGIKVEFAARIIPVITNMLVIQPLYLLSKKVANKTVAVMVVIVFCFSVWEVEFARFARMYSPFLLVFVWYLYFLFKHLRENDHKALKWIFILSFVSIFIYEASIFLSILNFFPFIWNHSKKTFDLFEIRKIKSSILNFLLCILIFIAAYFFISFNFATIGTDNNLPSNINYEVLGDHSGGKFRIPLILLTTLLSNAIWIIPFLIIASLSLYFSLKIYKNPVIEFSAKLSSLFLIILSLLNLFGLAAFVFILFLLINWIKTEDLKKIYKFIFIGFAVSFVYWSVYAIFTNSWYYYFPGKEISGSLPLLKLIWKEFTNYPYLYETYVLFRDTIPYSTILAVILLSVGIFITIFLKNSKKEEFKFLFFIFLFLLLFVATLNLVYFKTRYFFFLYPLLILLNFSTIERVVNKFGFNQKIRIIYFLVISAACLIISEDFNINHLYNIDSKEVNFRVNYSKKLKDHYYPRWDIKTPDEYVNNRAKKEDIIIINEQLNEFYLNKADYIYKDYTDNVEFSGISILGGEKEKWTGSKLIYKSSDLIDLLLKKNSNKWLVLNTVWGIRFLKADSFFVKFKKYEVFNNTDTTTIVYKIPPKPIVD